MFVVAFSMPFFLSLLHSYFVDFDAMCAFSTNPQMAHVDSFVVGIGVDWSDRKEHQKTYTNGET